MREQGKSIVFMKGHNVGFPNIAVIIILYVVTFSVLIVFAITGLWIFRSRRR